MKLTAAAGEHCWRNTYRICPEIWIDEAQLHSVIEADDVEGYVIQPQFGPGLTYRHQDGEILTRRRTGKVRFVGGELLNNS
jgi:hypothetical protein